MNDLLIETTVCHGCYAVLDAGDNYCRHCGTNLTGLSDARRGRAAGRSAGPGFRRPAAEVVGEPLGRAAAAVSGARPVGRATAVAEPPVFAALERRADAHHGGRDGVPALVHLVHLADVAGAAEGIGAAAQILRRLQSASRVGRAERSPATPCITLGGTAHAVRTLPGSRQNRPHPNPLPKGEGTGSSQSVAATASSWWLFSARLVSSDSCIVTLQRPSRSASTSQCGITTTD